MSSLPRRNLPSLRVIALRAFAVLIVGVSGLALAGCPGDLDPRLMATGTGGSGGTGGPQVCDGAALMRSGTCSQPGCHGANAPSAGLDLFSDGVTQRLVGRLPDPNGLGGVCKESTTPFLVAGSNPATGLLLEKLMNPAPCGTPMPYPGIMLLADGDIACLQEWATAVTTGQIQ